MTEQLLACAGQKEATPDTIEKLETEFLLEVADLPGQSRLGNAQAQRRLGDGAEFGNCDEGPGVAQVHVIAYAKSV